MDVIRCIAVDDDIISLSATAQFISLIDNIELIGEFSDSVEAIKAIKELTPDILFIDIQMPGISGLDIARICPPETHVVIISGHDKYTLKGFELGVLDYIMKPLTLGRLLKSVERYKLRKRYKPAPQKKDKNEAIFVTESYKTIKIFKRNIIYIESFKEYVTIVTETRNIKTKQRLKFFEGNLGDDFIRIHKSYIVAVKRILSFTNTEVEIKGKSFPVGRTFRPKLMQILNNSRTKN